MQTNQESLNCSCCQKPKPQLECGLCKNAVCKKCANFVAEDAFSFLTKVSNELLHQVYCHSCFEEKVNSQLQSYQEQLEKARQVIVYDKKQTKETRLIKRSEEPLKVLGCRDREETLLRLAFLAVQKKYNALLDVEITSSSHREGSYLITRWQGSGVPTTLNPDKLKSWSN